MLQLRTIRIAEFARTLHTANEMQVCTIAIDFRKALEPAKEFAYEDLAALELNF